MSYSEAMCVLVSILIYTGSYTQICHMSVSYSIHTFAVVTFCTKCATYILVPVKNISWHVHVIISATCLYHIQYTYMFMLYVCSIFYAHIYFYRTSVSYSIHMHEYVIYLFHILYTQCFCHLSVLYFTQLQVLSHVCIIIYTHTRSVTCIYHNLYTYTFCHMYIS